MKSVLGKSAVAVAVTGSWLTVSAASYAPVYLGLADPVRNASERTSGAIVGGSAVGIATAINFSGTPANVGERITYNGTTGTAAQLGTLGTGGDTVVNSVSVGGVAVGSSAKGSSGSLGARATRWLAGTNSAFELGDLGLSSAGVATSRAYAISPDGTYAAGYAEKYASGTKVGDRAVVWNVATGAPTELALIGDEAPAGSFNFPASSFANGVNNSGIAVGRSVKYNGATNLGQRPVRWAANGVATEMGNLGTSATGSTSSDVYTVNAAGTSIGVASKYDASFNNLNQRAVRWNAAGVPTELTNLGTYFQNGVNQAVTTPNSINASGVVVGQASVTSSNDNRAVRWSVDNTVTSLPRLGGPGSDTAYSINDAGIIVGQASFATSVVHATLWVGDIVIDLNSLLDPSVALDGLPSATFVLSTAYAITGDNWVTGIGQFDADGPGTASAAYSRAFLLQVPDSVLAVPEPSALVLLAAAPLALVRRRRI